jgi:ATP-binding protein involved in chromosome partitioning
MSRLEESVRGALAGIVPEELGCDLVSAGAVHNLHISDSRVILELRLGYPLADVVDELEKTVRAALEPLLESRTLALSLDWQVVPHRNQNGMKALDRVSNVIAVASGKGGVGKSTTAVNLALALRAQGARVGILDADIFGPSQPIMLGVPAGTKPEIKDEQFFIPVQAHGIELMSMGFLVDERSPVVWRGPKASGALQQLVNQTLWGDLDYLIVDLPPGTGDIQLTLAQRVPVAGSVVVTTPQDIALLDARKGIEMFRKVGIGVLGVVENMAVHVCSSCGHAEHVFGEGGGNRIADDYQTTLLGSLPLALSIREEADGGTPTVVARPDSAESRLYQETARAMAARLSLNAPAEREFPRVVMEHTPAKG